MQNQPTKVNGDSVSGDEFNQPNDELENIITSSGQTLSGADLAQAAKSIADYVGGVNYYLETGAADAYVLSVTGTFKTPTAYREGMEIRFRAANANTGAATVNVASLGVKNIKKADGSTALDAGDINTTHDTILRYNGTSFVLVSFGALAVNNLTSTNQSLANLTLGNKFNATPISATIASGVITYAGMNMVVDTEGAAATDDLDRITGGVAGDILILKQTNNARKIKIKFLSGGGASVDEINTPTDTDIQLTDDNDCVVLYKTTTFWTTIAVSSYDSFAYLKAVNGYTKLPNGIILQWGSFSSADSINTVVTFPITFPTSCICITLGNFGANGTDQYANGFKAISTTSNVSDVTIRNLTNGTNLCYWQALGF